MTQMETIVLIAAIIGLLIALLSFVMVIKAHYKNWRFVSEPLSTDEDVQRYVANGSKELLGGSGDNIIIGSNEGKDALLKHD